MLRATSTPRCPWCGRAGDQSGLLLGAALDSVATARRALPVLPHPADAGLATPVVTRSRRLGRRERAASFLVARSSACDAARVERVACGSASTSAVTSSRAGPRDDTCQATPPSAAPLGGAGVSYERGQLTHLSDRGLTASPATRPYVLASPVFRRRECGVIARASRPCGPSFTEVTRRASRYHTFEFRPESPLATVRCCRSRSAAARGRRGDSLVLKLSATTGARGRTAGKGHGPNPRKTSRPRVARPHALLLPRRTAAPRDRTSSPAPAGARTGGIKSTMNALRGRCARDHRTSRSPGDVSPGPAWHQRPPAARRARESCRGRNRIHRRTVSSARRQRASRRRGAGTQSHVVDVGRPAELTC